MKLFIVRYTELWNGKETWYRQEIYARDLDHAADKWSNMRLPHQQTEDIIYMDKRKCWRREEHRKE